jgi:hypothetical protein
LCGVADVFDFVVKIRVKPPIGGRYALAEAVQAHRDFESRPTTAKLPLP